MYIDWFHLNKVLEQENLLYNGNSKEYVLLGLWDSERVFWNTAFWNDRNSLYPDRDMAYISECIC